jgi:hypothetical protein
MTTERDDMDAAELITEVFPPGELRTAALCIDHLARLALLEVEDPDLHSTIAHYTIAIIGILCDVRDGKDTKDLLRTIDEASAQASSAVSLEAFSRWLARGRMN